MLPVNFKSIKNKFLITIISVLGIILALTVALTYFLSKNNLMETNMNEASTITLQTAKTIDIWIDARKNEVQALANNPISKLVNINMSEEDINKQIEFMKYTLKAYDKNFDIFFIAKTDGTYHTSEKKATGDLTTRDYWKDVMSGKTVISDPVISKSTGRVVSVVITPIYDNNGTIIGAFAGNVLIDNIKKIMPMSTRYSYIVNKDGLIIIHKDDQLSRTLNFLNLEPRNTNKEEDLKYNALLESLKLSTNDKKLLNQLGNKIKEILNLNEDIIAMDNDTLDLNKYSQEYNFKGKKLKGVFLPLNNGKWAVTVVYSLDEIYKEINNKMIIYIVVFIISLAVLGIVINFLTKPIIKISSIVKNLASGDLSTRYKVTTNDEMGEILGQLNTTTQNLESTILEVISSSREVSKAANEISSGNQDLSQRTQEQAASLEETSSAIEELTATVKQNANNAQKAKIKTDETAKMISNGNEIIKNTIIAMDKVNESSSKISEIINVVNDIAFQTNLLALNAAVESARAGEHGKGFAVVASEVRNLAKKSSEAVKEIQDLINDSVDKIQNSNMLVLKTGENLNEITKSIEEVTNLVSEISAASNQQAIGIDEVNKAIIQIDNITQQNSALVEEVSTTSELMNKKTKDLLEITKKFKFTT